ncbi:MAG: ATP-dependent zinc metalloprotease FtsH [Trueperaceae bacterium]|nr:ATP-dependent zinc metalloprotease FtsH [Trueperaceae bacterium]
MTQPQKPNQKPSGGSSPEQQPGQFRSQRFIFWLLIAAAIFFLLGNPFGPGAGQQISYTEFRQQLEDGNITRVTVEGEQIVGELAEPISVGSGEQAREIEQFVTFLPSFGDEQLLNTLREQGVEVNTRPAPDGAWTSILFALLPFLLLLGVGYFLFRRVRQQGQGMFSIGQSKAELYDREDADTTFDDVAGTEGAKEELQETITFLKNPKRFESLGGEIPKGILLVGPPGTGKTLLARAVAGEAGVPFFSTSGSDFMEMFVGVGASRVRDMFKEAKDAAPSIIFIDELDSVGRQRGAGLGGGNDEREQTLNQLLNEMDGFETTEEVIVMAATNRPDVLDQALLRPGRFDRQITIDAPNKQSRHEILKIHARNKPLSDDVDLEEVARSTPGLSGADLENLLNEAALHAARNDKDEIEKEDIRAARDKIYLGRERQGVVLTDEDKKLIAYHEGGHAVLAATLPHADPIEKVTIVPRGKAMGVTQQIPEREQYIYRREYLLDRLAVMMGGRASEDLVLDTATSGAANDFKQATQMARRMVVELGMSEKLGPVSFGGQQDQVFLGQELAQRKDYSEETGREIDLEIKRIVEEAYERAVTTLKEHRDGLDRLAQRLMDEEEIDGDVVLEILGLEPSEAEAEEVQTDKERDAAAAD